MVDKNKYLIGFIGLVIGFMISYFWASSYNRSNAPVAASGQPAAMPGGGPPNQQAMMAQVQQGIEKAKNNPKDFQAQIDAARMFAQVGRDAETVEYLGRAYAINPEEFIRQSKTDLEGALSFMGLYSAEQKKFEEAETWFRRALEANPNDSRVRVELATSFIQRQPAMPDKAIQELQLALKSNAKDAHALGHLVEAYALKKDARGAEEAFNNLKAADPANQRIASLQNMVADLKAGKSVSIPKE